MNKSSYSGPVTTKYEFLKLLKPTSFFPNFTLLCASLIPLNSRPIYCFYQLGLFIFYLILAVPYRISRQTVRIGIWRTLSINYFELKLVCPSISHLVIVLQLLFVMAY